MFDLDEMSELMTPDTEAAVLPGEDSGDSAERSTELTEEEEAGLAADQEEDATAGLSVPVSARREEDEEDEEEQEDDEAEEFEEDTEELEEDEEDDLDELEEDDEEFEEMEEEDEDL